MTALHIFSGAGDGNRTHLSSLGSSHSTDELRPQSVHKTQLYYITTDLVSQQGSIIYLVLRKIASCSYSAYILSTTQNKLSKPRSQ